MRKTSDEIEAYTYEFQLVLEAKGKMLAMLEDPAKPLLRGRAFWTGQVSPSFKVEVLEWNFE